MSIAVTGANGQLGSELCRRFGGEAVALTRPGFDMTSRESIVAELMAIEPTAVINCAAYTAVDKAEEEFDTCHLVNAESVSIIAEICDALEIPLVQISSDYVFGANTKRSVPYRENDATGPLGAYARTKHEGELNAAYWQKHFIIRTCGLYSCADDGPVRGRNFVDTMLHLGRERDELTVVSDQFCTPTYVPHLVTAIEYLLTTEDYGTYHVVNTGSCSWIEFAGEIFRQSGLEVKLNETTTEAWGAPAPRPLYSVLDTSKFHDLCGPRMPSWQQGIADYLEQLEASQPEFLTEAQATG
ncbi:MAG: dTDP-4-dehydrorhamnose reductase [Planctomycetota bacterium]